MLYILDRCLLFVALRLSFQSQECGHKQKLWIILILKIVTSKNFLWLICSSTLFRLDFVLKTLLVTAQNLSYLVMKGWRTVVFGRSLRETRELFLFQSGHTLTSSLFFWFDEIYLFFPPNLNNSYIYHIDHCILTIILVLADFLSLSIRCREFLTE